MKRLRVPARVVCGLLLVVAFLLLGPETEHEVAPWIVTSIGAALGMLGVGLGGAVVSFTAVAFSIGVLRDHGPRGAVLCVLLGITCALTEPWGWPANGRRPRFSTSAFVFGLLTAPATIMLAVVAVGNFRYAEPATPTIAPGALVVCGGPLFYYAFGAVKAQKLFPDLGGAKRLAAAAIALAALWAASLGALGTYVINKR